MPMLRCCLLVFELRIARTHDGFNTHIMHTHKKYTKRERVWFSSTVAACGVQSIFIRLARVRRVYVYVRARFDSRVESDAGLLCVFFHVTINYVDKLKLQ